MKTQDFKKQLYRHLVPALIFCACGLPAVVEAQTNGTVRFGMGGATAIWETGNNVLFLDWVDVEGPASVVLHVTGGTAQEGVDFQRIIGQVVTHSPGQTFSQLWVAGVADALSEGPETIELTLTNPTGGVVIGSPSRVIVVLVDDPNVKSFSLWTYESTSSERTTWRSAGTVVLGVSRAGPMMEAAEVHYQTEPGTAQSGVDYAATGGTLRFGTNENWKSIEIPILTNNLAAGDRSFRVALSNPTVGYVLGTPSEQTVRILNDGAGLALEPRFGTSGAFEVPENVGEALVDVVIRGDTTTRPVRVDYRTAPISATPIEDYTPVSGTLTFTAGETRKTISIPITNDSRYERGERGNGFERFNLVLENPSGGLYLSRPREVEIVIQDNDQGYSIAGADNNSTLYLDEKSGTVTVNVNRQGDFNAPSSVRYRVTATNDYGGTGSATPGLDFVPAEGTLNFDATETNKTFTITILDDSLIEGDEDFYIVLDQATGGIHTPDVQVMIIHDNERNPVRVDPDFKPDWPIPHGRSPPLCVASLGGKILLATPTDRQTGEHGTFVLRLMPDGRPDPAWKVPDIRGEFGSLVPQTNGQVLIAAWGPSGPDFTVNGVSRRHLARLNGDGSLDTAFSAALPTDMVVDAIAVQSGGQALLAVHTNTLPSTSPLRLIRLNAFGGLDTVFNSPVLNGIYVATILPALDEKIVVAGWEGHGFFRFKSDGSPDEQLNPPPNAALKAMLPNGQLMVTFETNEVQYLARLKTTGNWIRHSLSYRSAFRIRLRSCLQATGKSGC